MQAEPSRIPVTLRPARRDEAARLVTFYQGVNDPNVLPRPLKDFEAAARTGAFFVIETPDTEWIAASGIFEIAPSVNGYAEAGATYVADRFRGCGLQGTLIEARAAASVVNLSGTVLVTAVKPTNAPSLHNVKRAGLQPWSTPIKELFDACVTCDLRANLNARACCCDFYAFGEDESRSAIRRLLRKLPSFETKPSTTGAIVLEVSFKGLLFENANYLDDLRDFAK